MTHNKYFTIPFLVDNDAISAKPPAYMLFIYLAYPFILLIFLITGLCNS